MRRSWHELPPSQQAGILCKEGAFQRFMHARNEEEAADTVCLLCRVSSRRNISANNKIWRYIVEDYRAFMREPEVI